MLRYGDVGICEPRQSSAHKGKKEELEAALQFFLWRIAFHAFEITARGEMSRTRPLQRKLKQHSIGTNGLITVVGNDGAFALEQSKEQREIGRAGEKHGIGLVNQPS